jgi:hypothetical protein
MEKMVNKRLVHVIDERNLLPEQQYGFRKSRSTTDVQNILNTHIIKAIRKKEYWAMLSLDISRAYDTCWRRGILNTLKTWKINGKMLGFPKNFMSNRNTLSLPMSIENGVVQGAVQSVTFFLVTMASIAYARESRNRQKSLNTQMIESYTRTNGHHKWPKTS